MDLKLKDKVVLVTGGYGDLGTELVIRFLQEGAKVAFCGRSQEKVDAAEQDFRKISDQVLGIRCDVGNSPDVQAMFDKIVEHFGTLDILVNNAGVARNAPKDRDNYFKLTMETGQMFSLGVTRSMTDEEWLDSMNNNLNSVFYCTRAALNIMEPKGYGKIINVSSTAGISNTSAHSPSYSTAKGAIAAFTRSVAREVIGAGVIVNAVAPGGILTKFWKNPEVGKDILDKVTFPIPAKRMGTVHEHASLILYLASDEANYIVGQVVSANGGLYM